MYKKSLASILAVVLVCSMFFFVSVKPVSDSNTQIFWGAFVGPSHIDTPAQFEMFSAQIGKGLSLWENFQYWDRPQDSENNPNFDTAWMDACRSYGAIPLVTWDPGDGSGEVNTYLPSIISGHYDAYITQFAQAAKAWGNPFFIRFLHQTLYKFDADAAAQYSQSFIHVENIFRSVGETQVSWIWGPSYDFVKDTKIFAAAYPGDSYVDWVGMGGYNWGDSTTFNQMFNTWYHVNLQVAPNKPQMITEVGFCDSSYKASLFTDMLKTQLPNNYPAIKALVYWEGFTADTCNVESNTLGKGEVDIQAFREGIALDHYVGNVFSNLSVSPLEDLSGRTASDSNPTTTFSSRVVIAVFIVAIVFVVVAQRNSKRN